MLAAAHRCFGRAPASGVPVSCVPVSCAVTSDVSHLYMFRSAHVRNCFVSRRNFAADMRISYEKRLDLRSARISSQIYSCRPTVWTYVSRG